MRAFADRRVRVEGRRVAYLDAGPAGGVPLVLLHGAGFDHAELSWRLTVEALCDERRVIVPDLPGYGRSASITTPQGLPRLGRWLAAFLDALGLGRVDLAGVSMGGGMALWLAIERPERVRRLVPVCAYGIMRRAPFHPLARAAARCGALGLVFHAAATSPTLARLGLAASYAHRAAVTETTVTELMAAARDPRARASFERFLAAEFDTAGLRTDLTSRLGGIEARTLVVTGASDRLVAPRHCRRAARLIPGGRLLELPTGHWPMRERPDLFVPALRDFLAG